MVTECIFPVETVCHILTYSSSKDVIRWRTVSKWFRAITHHSVVWKALYAKLRLPPGPFPSQLTAFLEWALVRAEKLAQSWTTTPMRAVSHIELQHERGPGGHTKLLGGRWLIGCESSSRFVLHDVGVSPEIRVCEKQVIWELDGEVFFWDVSSVTRAGGQFVVYVLLRELQLDADLEWKLVEFRLDGKSGELRGATAFDIPLFVPKYEDLDYEARLQGGRSPFLYMPDMELLFDTRTHIFYEFPEFLVTLDETLDKLEDADDNIQRPDFVVLASTHVLAFYNHSRVFTTHIQAFTVDESSVRTGKGVLRLSHEGVSNNYYESATLLRNSIVDSTTGSTNMRLLDLNLSDCFICEDLTLPRYSGDNDILPITVVEDRNILLRGKSPETERGTRHYVDCSDAGYLRGFYRTSPQRIPHVAHMGRHFSEVRHITKFSIDATQDECILEFGKLSLPEWNHFHDPKHRAEVSWDGARRRLCFVNGTDPSDNQQVIVVDVE